MARYTCVRCNEESNTLDAPHLCKDVKKRFARREKQRDAVVRILAINRHAITNLELVDVAEEIVTKLAQMGVEQED